MTRFVQRDLGTAAEVSSGGGGRGLLRELVLVVGATLLLVTVAYAALGWIVEVVLPHISVEREQRWFHHFRPPSTWATAAAGDEEEVIKVRAVLARLTAEPGVPDYDFDLVVLLGDEPNAFAIPGGTIGVTRGLLDLLQDDDVALAFVLGHELGHFAHRDQLRGLGRQVGRALLWSVLFGDGGGDVLSDQLPTLLDLRHSRAAEAAADRFALRLVLGTYGTAQGAERLFVWLEEQGESPRWAAMFATHPAPADRIQALRDYAKDLEREDAGGTP
jgi:Zn-dependent protease with chaperone function